MTTTAPATRQDLYVAIADAVEREQHQASELAALLLGTDEETALKAGAVLLKKAPAATGTSADVCYRTDDGHLVRIKWTHLGVDVEIGCGRWTGGQILVETAAELQAIVQDALETVRGFDREAASGA